MSSVPPIGDFIRENYDLVFAGKKANTETFRHVRKFLLVDDGTTAHKDLNAHFINTYSKKGDLVLLPDQECELPKEERELYKRIINEAKKAWYPAKPPLFHRFSFIRKLILERCRFERDFYQSDDLAHKTLIAAKLATIYSLLADQSEGFLSAYEECLPSLHLSIRETLDKAKASKKRTFLLADHLVLSPRYIKLQFMDLLQGPTLIMPWGTMNRHFLEFVDNSAPESIRKTVPSQIHYQEFYKSLYPRRLVVLAPKIAKIKEIETPRLQAISQMINEMGLFQYSFFLSKKNDDQKKARAYLRDLQRADQRILTRHLERYEKNDIHHFCSCGETGMVKKLLDEGIPLCITDPSGYYPLYLAAKGGHSDTVKAILTHPSCKDRILDLLWVKNGPMREPAAELDCVVDTFEFQDALWIMVKNFLDRAAQGDQSSEFKKSLEDFLAYLHRINRGCFDQRGSIGLNYSTYLLAEAIKEGFIDLVKIILESPEWQDQEAGQSQFLSYDLYANRNTILHLACLYGQTAIVQVLLDRGAALMKRNRRKEYPLYLAIQTGQERVVEIILNHLSVLPILTKLLESRNSQNRETALHLAARLGVVGIVQLLLDKGAALDARDQNNVRPLFYAAEQGQLGVVKACLSHPNWHPKSHELMACFNGDFGGTVLGAAAFFGHCELVSYLLDRGARLDFPDQANCLPIFKAVEGQQSPIVNAMVHHPLWENKVSQLLSFKNGTDLGNFEFTIEGCSDRLIFSRSSRIFDYACETGCIEIVEILLRCGASLDNSHPDELPPLFLALFATHAGVLKVILNHPGVRDQIPSLIRIERKGHHLNLLDLACQRGNVEMVQLLLDHGLPPEGLDKESTSPLFKALWKQKYQIVEAIMNHSASQSKKADLALAKDPITFATPLQFALDRRLQESFWLLFDACSGILELTDLFEHVDPDVTMRRLTDFLHFAIIQGRFDLVKLVFNHPNWKERVPEFLRETKFKGQTLMHTVARVGVVEIAHFLLDAGASLEIQDTEFRFPLYIAAYQGHLAIVELFLGHPEWKEKIPDLMASANSKLGETALHAAAYAGHAPIVKCLLDRGAQLNTIDAKNSSPLHLAALKGRVETVAMMLEHPVWKPMISELIDYPNERLKSTALRAAASRGHVEVAKLLLDRGASLDVVDANGRTPLYYACFKGHEAVVESILSHPSISHRIKEVVNYVNGQGNEQITALYIACQQGHDSVAQLLVRWGACLERHIQLSLAIEFPLYAAACRGCVGLFEMILADSELKKAAPRLFQLRCHQYDKKIPLYGACENGHLEIVQLLFKEDAWKDEISHVVDQAPALYYDPFELKESPYSFAGTQAMLIAAERNHVGIVKFLIQEGVGIPSRRHLGDVRDPEILRLFGLRGVYIYSTSSDESDQE